MFKGHFFFISTMVVVLSFVAGFFFKVNAGGNFPPITVMQIDTGVDYEISAIGDYIPEKYKIKENMDRQGHGTNVAGIILDGVCEQVKLIPCNYYGNPFNRFDPLEKEVECLRQAAAMDIDIINFSGGGALPDEREFALLKKMDKKNVVVIVAAGNDGQEISLSNDVTALKKKIKAHKTGGKFYYFPASYDLKNVIKVSNYQGAWRDENSNYATGFVKEDGNAVYSWAPGGSIQAMSGTSQSTAKFTNKVLKAICNLYK